MIFTERNQFLSDVLAAALEGGINYWATIQSSSLETVDGRPQYTGAIVVDTEDQSAHAIDLDTIDRGIRGAIDLANTGQIIDVPELRSADGTDGRRGDVDAFLADLVVQAALFDTVIYG